MKTFSNSTDFEIEKQLKITRRLVRILVKKLLLLTRLLTRDDDNNDLIPT